MEPISPQQASERLGAGWQPFVLDVRTSEESARSRLTFTDLLCPYDALDRVANQLPDTREILVYCARGQRSAYACQWLEAQGFRGLYNLEGGLHEWTAQIGTSLSSD